MLKCQKNGWHLYKWGNIITSRLYCVTVFLTSASSNCPDNGRTDGQRKVICRGRYAIYNQTSPFTILFIYPSFISMYTYIHPWNLISSMRCGYFCLFSAQKVILIKSFACLSSPRLGLLSREIWSHSFCIQWIQFVLASSLNPFRDFTIPMFMLPFFNANFVKILSYFGWSRKDFRTIRNDFFK